MYDFAVNFVVKSEFRGQTVNFAENVPAISKNSEGRIEFCGKLRENKLIIVVIHISRKTLRSLRKIQMTLFQLYSYQNISKRVPIRIVVFIKWLPTPETTRLLIQALSWPGKLNCQEQTLSGK